MTISTANDIVSYSIWQAQQDVKNKTQISLLKKSLDMQKDLMVKMLQSLQEASQATMQQPPKNPKGDISIYA